MATAFLLHTIQEENDLNYGYYRSEKESGQDIAVYETLKNQDIPEDNIFCDQYKTPDGNNTPQFYTMCQQLKPGDVLFLSALNDLGKEYSEILNRWKILTQEKSANIVVCESPSIDTRSKDELTRSMMLDIIQEMLVFGHKMEQNSMHNRQAQGIAAARARGVRFGRPEKPLPVKYEEILQKWQRGEISGRAAARELGMPSSTFRHKALKDQK